MNKILHWLRLTIVGCIFAAGISAQAQLTMIPMEGDVCWKDSYGRGAGTIPTTCATTQDKDGLLCYPKCQAGYGSAGPVCWQYCPSGFRDDGAFCAKPAAYGRGAGYAWRPDGFDWSMGPTVRACEADNGAGNCEQYGAIIYPKCRAGFSAVGSNICSPNCPSGFADIGVSCTKPSYGRGAGTPMQCDSTKQNDTGLCYPGCNAGYGGVGPVCWGSCPATHPINCGAMCGKTTDDCVKQIAGQVLAGLEVLSNILQTVATAGASAAVKATAVTAAKAAMKKVAKDLLKSSIKGGLTSLGTSLASGAGKSMVAGNTAQLESALAGEDFDPTSLDPTGIADMVKTFQKPICGTQVAAAPQPLISKSFDFKTWGGANWTATAQGAYVALQKQGLASEGVVTRFDYVTWDGTEWTAFSQYLGFRHQKRGATTSHYDTAINYKSWDGSNWRADIITNPAGVTPTFKEFKLTKQ